MIFNSRMTVPRDKEITLMFHRVLICLITVGCLAFSGIGSSRAQNLSDTGKTLDAVRLQLKWKHQFQFAGYYAAIEKGYYRDEGLAVELLEARDEEEPAQSVLKGRADFGIATSDLVLLRSKGEPVVALASIFQHSPLVIVGSRRAGIENVHDLAGKRVMIEHHAAELFAYLQREQVFQGQFTLLPHSFDARSLIAGRVDAISAYLTDEPFELQQAHFDYTTLTPLSSGIDFYGDTLFTTETEIKNHPNRVASFVRASERGWRYALSHQEEMVSLILTVYGTRHSREHLRHEAGMTLRMVMPDIVEIGYMNPERWQHIADIYAEAGLIAPGFNISSLLYDTKPRMLWFYLSLSGASLLLAIVFLVALRFYRMAGTIRRQMADLENASSNLKAAEERYRFLTENAPFPIMITRPSDGTLHYLNPLAARQLHIARDFALGKPAVSFYSNPEDREQIYETLEKQGFVRGREVKMKTASGTHFWASLSLSFIDYGGDRAVVSSFIDITERKQSEDTLRKAHNHLNAIVEFLPDPTFVVDTSGRVTAWNKAMEEMTGVSRTDMIHKGDYAYAIPIYAERRPTLIDLILAPDPELEASRYEYIDRQGDLLYGETYAPAVFGGKGAFIWSSASVLRDSNGAAVGAIQTIRDITERKTAEQQRLQLEQRLLRARKSESLGRMAGAIAHHFNNKLMVVMGNLELALNGVPADSNAHKYLSHAMEASRQAVDISRMMLAGSDQTIERKETLALGALVSEALSFLGASLPPNVELQKSIPDEEPLILADAGHINRILANLVLNASEAIDTAKGRIAVEVYEASKRNTNGLLLLPHGWEPKSEGYACLSVTDNGCGLDADTLEAIFDPFFSTKFVGRGLGLSVVMGLVKAYEGAIAVQSEPGIGTVFLVFFPLATGKNGVAAARTLQSA